MKTQYPEIVGDSSMPGSEPVGAAAEVVGLTKIFGTTVAVNDVSFAVYPGEVLALVGENGAGKSTCAKMIGGVYKPDSGFVRVAGEEVHFHSPLEAQSRGVSVVHQHPALFPDLSAAENVFAGKALRNRFGLLDRNRMHAQTAELLELLGLAGHASTPVGLLRTSEQQLVEIARSLAADSKVLILDEPTAALTTSEVGKLFAVVDSLRSRGVAMIFVGHRLEEIFQISDRIAILRDGKYVDTLRTSETSEAEVVRLMVGRELGNLYPETNAKLGDTVLQISDLSLPGSFQDISLNVRAGEIVGIAGLVGSGRTEVARAIFGIDRPARGTIALDGKEITLRSPSEALAHGIAYVSEDRRGQSLVEDFSILENATLPVIHKATRWGLIRKSAEYALVDEPLRKMKLKFASFAQPIGDLSGGNQQKVVIAKWLATAPRLLILDEPTQGIDVQAKAEVHKIVAALARQGIGILMISSDMPELLGMCDRIYVMRHGEVVTEFDRSSADQLAIGMAATGISDEAVDTKPELALESLIAEGDEPRKAPKLPRPLPAMPAWLQRLFTSREASLLAALVAIVVPLSIVNPRLLSPTNISDLAINTALFGVVAVGQMIVMLTRNIDLSVGSVIGLSAFVAASVMRDNPTLPVLAGVGVAVAVGLGCGLVNGLIVAYGDVPSIVVTLGTLALYRGLDSILSSGRQVASSDVPQAWLDMTNFSLAGIPILVWIGLAVFVLAGFVLTYTRPGRETYAVGSNPAGAVLVGIPARRRILTAFVVAGALGGLAGALWASRYATVDGQLAYGVELTVIASVVVGGIALRGGSGTVAGVALGTFALLVIQNALTLARVNPQYLQAVFGAAIVLAITVDALLARSKRKSRKAIS